MTTLFAPSTPSAVGDKVSGVLNSLEDTLWTLSTEVTHKQTSHQPNSQVSEDEVQRLQDIITKLKEELSTFHDNLLFIRLRHVP
jgi:cob(I)alamin adenosyltransferase